MNWIIILPIINFVGVAALFVIMLIELVERNHRVWFTFVGIIINLITGLYLLDKYNFINL